MLISKNENGEGGVFCPYRKRSLPKWTSTTKWYRILSFYTSLDSFQSVCHSIKWWSNLKWTKKGVKVKQIFQQNSEFQINNFRKIKFCHNTVPQFRLIRLTMWNFLSLVFHIKVELLSEKNSNSMHMFAPFKTFIVLCCSREHEILESKSFHSKVCKISSVLNFK